MSLNLNDYINQSRSRGMTDEEIVKKLSQAGWSESDIQSGLSDEPPVPQPHSPMFSKKIVIGLLLIFTLGILLFIRSLLMTGIQGIMNDVETDIIIEDEPTKAVGQDTETPPKPETEQEDVSAENWKNVAGTKA